MKRKVIVCVLIAIVAAMFLCLSACGKTQSIEVTFDGEEQTYSIKEGQKLTPPEVSLNAHQNLLGWALTSDATKAKITGETIEYQDVVDLAKDGKITLYPVVENTIGLTIKGLADSVAVLSDKTLNTAKLPLVEQSDRQVFLGWATSENATEAAIASGENVNYENALPLASNGVLTLYPVVETYDLMIAVHASHSNMLTDSTKLPYIDDEQYAEIKAQFNAYLQTYKTVNSITGDVKVLWSRIDFVNAANFASEVVKKDYDIVISSKTIVTDLQTAKNLDATQAVIVGDIVEMTCVPINQSRQVCLTAGHDNVENYPYAQMAYEFFTTKVDYVIDVNFEGDETVYQAHRATDNAVEPVGITAPEGQDVIGWALSATSQEAVVQGVVTYDKVSQYATDGTVKLYPIFGKYNVKIALYYRYVETDENLSILEAAFDKYLQDNALSGIKVLFRKYEGKISAATLGSMINTDGDIDLIIGCGDNINTDGGVTVLAKSRRVADYLFDGIDKGQFAALVSENQHARAFYAMLVGKEDLDATINFNVDGEVTASAANSLIDNAAEQPTVDIPSGKVFVGWSTSETATEAQFPATLNIVLSRNC